MSDAARTILTTERLVIREFTIDDVEFIVHLLNQPSFLRNIGDRGVRTIEDAQAYIEQGPLADYACQGFGVYVVALGSDPTPIGMCGVMRKPWLEAPDIAYAFLPEYEGKGYASEAAGAILDHAHRTIGLDVIVGVVIPENTGSIRVLEKLGFKLKSQIIDPRNNHELNLYVHRVSAASATTVNIKSKLAQFDERWSPKLVAQVNDTDVKLVKLHGEFVWHHHDEEDELFLVISGRLLMQFRDREEWVEEGEFIVVPHGVEHRPVAPEEVHVMLIERRGTLNTGNVVNERTVHTIESV